MPTARSSANLTKPNPTPTRHTLTKDKIILQTATPQAASSQRIHISRTQGRGRTHPVTGRVTTQCLHTQSVTTCRRWTQMCRHASTSLSRREYQSHSVAFFTYRPLIRSNSMFCAEKMQEISTCGPVEYCPTQAVPFAPPPPPHRRSAQQ